jgi:hypothetical protein
MSIWDLLGEEIEKLEFPNDPERHDIWSILKIILDKKRRETISSTEEEIQTHNRRIGDVNPDIQLRAVLKASILKQLIGKDSVIRDEERLFFIEHVLSSSEMESEVKVALILDLDFEQTTFWEFLKKNLKREDLLTTHDELHDFKNLLNELSYVDGDVDYSEKKFIDSLLN